MTEQYCLRWNNHQSTVISVFENLLESGSLIDCTLCADGKLLKAHKVVLSACSSVFESMLCQQGGDKHPIIFLKDVRFEEMKAMLDYMYKGEANVHQELLDSFLKTAASLQIKGLTDQGGGGGTDEPPPKKGPGVNANRKAPPPLDATPESSREGSISPTMSRKRRRPTNNMAGVRRPSSEDASADNSCDTIPMSSAQNVSNQQYQAAPPVASQPPSLPMPQPSQSMETARVTIKKQEPLDQTPQSMIQPKTEFIDESNEDVEDLTLDDDDDYNDSMSEMSKPGTSYSMQQPSQDFQWSQMMGGNDSRSGADESFMQQDSVNNQGNTQGSEAEDEDEIYMDEVDRPNSAQDKTTAAETTFSYPNRIKSKQKYDETYRRFTEWRAANGLDSFSEDVLVAYFEMIGRTMAPATLWVVYSMLKCTLKLAHDVEIQYYRKLKNLLKERSVGFVPKKRKSLSREQIDQFLREAPDKEYLLEKVALVIGLCGACRSRELVALKMSDFQDLGSAVLVTITDPEKETDRTFTLTGNFYKVFKKYVAMRPLDVCSRFFLNYQQGRCTRQPVGINKISKFPVKIAKFLKLDEPGLYSGHCYRRSSSTVIVDCGGEMKRPVRWRKDVKQKDEVIVSPVKRESPEFFSCQ